MITSRHVVKTSGPLTIASGSLIMAAPLLLPYWIRVTLFWTFILAAAALLIGIIILIIEARQNPDEH
jgi:hypothetical protein